MKKLLVIILAFVGMQLSAQDLNSLKATASQESSSIIDKLAGEQVMRFTKKLNLNPSQQKMATDLVVSQLKSEKFQKLIRANSGSNLSDVLNNALLEEPKFNMQLSEVLDETQKQELEKLNAR